ncbi:hypothetical protein BC829DRAFT_57908 [Chytridium lagenaria]|nr:hypothetical protein BC829DRAFT_57908 [Chytridium lagenaria]
MQGFHLFDILMAILRVSIPTVTVGVVVGAELLMMLGRFEQAIIRQFDRIQLPSGFRSAIADPVVFWGFAWLIMQDLMLFCHAAPAARKKVDHTVLYFEVGKFTSISRSVCLVALLRWILTGVFLNWFEVTRTMFLISMPLISFIVNFMGQSLFLQYHLKPVQRIVRSFIGAIMFSISTGWFSWASAIVLYMNSLSPIYSGIAKASVFLILRFVGVAFLTSILNRLRTTEVFNAKANLKKRRGALGKNQKVAPDEAKVDSDKAQKEDLDEADINGTKEGSEKKNETPAKQSAKPDPKASFITFFSSTENVMDSEEANEIGLNTSALYKAALSI